MARRIEITQMDDFFQEKIIDLVQATTLEWTKRVKKATPVDTGRFGKVVALKNSTVDLVAENIKENTSSTISGIPLHHSAEICGVITSVQVASGDAVIAYRL